MEAATLEKDWNDALVRVVKIEDKITDSAEAIFRLSDEEKVRLIIHWEGDEALDSVTELTSSIFSRSFLSKLCTTPLKLHWGVWLAQIETLIEFE